MRDLDLAVQVEAVREACVQRFTQRLPGRLTEVTRAAVHELVLSGKAVRRSDGTVFANQRSAVERHGRTVDDRGDADRVVDLIFGRAVLEQRGFVRADASFTGVYGAHREREQLECGS